jgi:hypothetical protein
LGFESSLVSQHSNPFLVDTTVVPMQSSVDNTLVFGSDASLDHVVSHHVQPTVVSMQSSVETTHVLGDDASLDHVVSHPIQPMVKEVVVSMQSLVDPDSIFDQFHSFWGGDASLDHALIISGSVTYEKGIIPLSLSKLPPLSRTISFDWDDIVELCLPSFAPF